MRPVRGAHSLKPWPTVFAISRRIGLSPCVQPIAHVHENGSSELVASTASHYSALSEWPAIVRRVRMKCNGAADLYLCRNYRSPFTPQNSLKDTSHCRIRRRRITHRRIACVGPCPHSSWSRYLQGHGVFLQGYHLLRDVLGFRITLMLAMASLLAPSVNWHRLEPPWVRGVRRNPTHRGMTDTPNQRRTKFQPTLRLLPTVLLQRGSSQHSATTAV